MTTSAHTEDGSHILARPDAITDAAATSSGRAPFSRDLANVAMDDLGGGIVRITLRPGSQISKEDGAMVRAQFLAQSGGAGTAVLLQITGVNAVSREAARFLSEAATVTAFAILGNTPVDRVIAHGRRGLPVPKCPTRYFSDERQALAWLQGLTRTALSGR